MTLNFSNRKKLIASGFILSIISGCSTTNRQSSAPIYKEPSTTNPYAEKTITEGHAKNLKHKKYPSKSRSKKRLDLPVVRKPLSPAVLALLEDADTRSKAGDIEGAVVTIERALRIDARNPVLTYKLAMLQLHLSKPRLAEDLAKKAALLSAGDKKLKKQSWLLISEARRQQQNLLGAEEARLKANKF
jgi:predicted Zn-dependent protease